MPPVPPPAELALLRARVMELEAENARLREAAAARDELAAAQLAAAQAQLAARDAQLQALAARVEELERRLGKDSGTSSKPPSSDSPYQKKTRDRSLRGRSGRRPGKQPGAQSSTLKQSADPGQRAECAPAACGCCGADLGDAAVIGMQKRQVFEAPPPPPPTVIEYQVQAKACARCGAVTEGVAPAHATGRAQYGPLVHAKAALAVCAHHLPVARAARLVSALTGVTVSTGFMAGIRAKAAARLGPFMDRVRELLRSAGVRSADDIDAGNALPGYAGTIVRDGYAGYQHLADALHAWCGAHGLRDLRELYRWDPGGQVWARSMADLLIHANAAATAARAAGNSQLAARELAEINAWYRGAVAKGITGNQHKRSKAAKDGLRLDRKFRDHQDMILRFSTNLTVGFTSNQAERDVRPVKVQMRTSGGCWRTLEGLADFAMVQSYLSTAAKWGIDQLDALTQLFTDGPWLPAAIRPG